MREILFRGKEIETGKWFYGSLCHYLDDNSYYISFTDNDGDDIGCRADPETVGQYIGRTDKHGTKIFEGDIIKIRKSTDFDGKPITFKGIVCFNEDECGFTIGKNGMKGYCISSLASYIFKSSATEIIGNFYDNPELLEE